MELLLLIAYLSIGKAFPTGMMVNLVSTSSPINQSTDRMTTMLPHSAIMSPEGLRGSENNKSVQHEEIIRAIEKLRSVKGHTRTFGSFANFAVGGLLAVLDLVDEVMEEGNSHNTHMQDNVVRMRRDKLMQEVASTTTATTYQVPMTLPVEMKSSTTTMTNNIKNSTVSPLARQESDSDNEVDSNDAKDKKKENQESKEDSEEEEGDGGGLIGAILTGFLGSLSKPDGAVDVNAVVSVIGSLSALQDDGTYDFTGLSDTLNAFFGGDEDGGGSDVGSFLGGVIAAAITGIASPPGAKGAGALVGNLLKQVLPAISGPGPMAEGMHPSKPQVDAGGFLGGLLKTLFGGNGAANGQGGQKPGMFYTIKTNLLKFVFSALSSILATSSSSGKMPEKS